MKKKIYQDEGSKVVVIVEDKGILATYKYGDRVQMIIDQLILLGDVDIYTVRNAMFQIIKEIEHWRVKDS